MAPDAYPRVDHRTNPLVGPLRRLACAILRSVDRLRGRTPKLTTCPPPSPSSPSKICRFSPPVDAFLCGDYSNQARGLCLSLESICGLLEEGDIRIDGELPVSAGGFADLWKGFLDDLQVAIKSYRPYLSIEPARAFTRFRQEALISSRLSHKNIVSFIGIYSTTNHPFSLVFDFAGNLDLKSYLRIHPSTRRFELLVGIARGLDHMHDLNIVHGRLEAGNVLVDLDGTPRIAGLGSALILDDSSSLEKSGEWLFRGSAPGLMCPEEFGLSYPRNSKAGDVYAFGILVWEVFTGCAVFPDSLDVVAVHKMWGGTRPPRPNHPEVTDKVWALIERCWERKPSNRMTIKQVLRTLEAQQRDAFYGSL